MVEKIVTPRGDGRSMVELSPSSGYSITVNGNPPSGAGYSGSGWFGPLQPMQPIAPPQVAGRVFDFAPGYNLATTPRAYEPVSFEVLRMMAESFDPMRLIIERRKDQMCRLPWNIRYKKDDKKKSVAPKDMSEKQRKRLTDITNFFKKPDREVSFRSWMRAVLDDLLVIDAPSIYCERNRGGGLIGLRYLDGANIKRIIDDWGRTPEPIPFTGQPFQWNGGWVTMENHQAAGFRLVPGSAVAGQMPFGVEPPPFAMLPPSYQQVLKGLPAVNYTTWDLLYRPFNLRPGRVYGMSPVEQVVTTVNIALRRNMAQLDYYREGNQPESIYGVPEGWTPDQVGRFQDYWDALHVGNMAARRRMKFLPGGNGSNYTALKEPPLKTEFDEWLIRIVCFAFSYPPAAFVSLQNRSIAETHERQAEEEGVEPLKQWAAELFNEILEREFPDDGVEFAWAEENEIDPEKQSTILRGYAEDGVFTLNMVREKLGEEPDPNPAANRLMVKTGVGYVPIEAMLLENKVADAKAMADAVPAPTPTPVKTGGPKTPKDTEE